MINSNRLGQTLQNLFGKTAHEAACERFPKARKRLKGTEGGLDEAQKDLSDPPPDLRPRPLVDGKVIMQKIKYADE